MDAICGVGFLSIFGVHKLHIHQKSQDWQSKSNSLSKPKKAREVHEHRQHLQNIPLLNPASFHCGFSHLSQAKNSVVYPRSIKHVSSLIFSSCVCSLKQWMDSMLYPPVRVHSDKHVRWQRLLGSLIHHLSRRSITVSPRMTMYR